MAQKLNLKKISSDGKYPALQKAAELNQDIWADLQLFRVDTERDVREFYAPESLSNNDNSSNGGDDHYNLYESLKGLSLDTVKDDPYISDDIKDDVIKFIKAYEGDFDFNSPAASLLTSQNLANLRAIQAISNTRYRIDPHMRSAINNIIIFLFGNGIVLNIENAEIESAEFSAYEIKSSEINTIEVSSDNISNKLTYGVTINYQADLGLNSKPNKQKQVFIPDIEYALSLNARGGMSKFGWTKSKHRVSKKDVMLFIKFGDKRELRGLCPVEPMLKALRLHEDFVVNRAILNYERSKVLYIHRIKTGSNPKLGQSNSNKTKSPKGGTEMTLFGNEEYDIKSPSLHAQDAKEDGLLFMHEAASAINIPVSLLSQRIDQGNYNSQKNAESPFTQFILDLADFYVKNIKQLCKYILKGMVDAGELPPATKIKTFSKESTETDFVMKALDILKNNEADSPNINILISDYKDSITEIEVDTTDIPIDVIIADSVRPNPLEMAKVWFIYRNMGVISRQTLADKSNLVWERELYRMLKEKKFFPDTQNTSTSGGVSDKTNPAIDGMGANNSGTGTNVNPGDGTAAQ